MMNTYSCKDAKPNLASVVFNAPTRAQGEKTTISHQKATHNRGLFAVTPTYSHPIEPETHQQSLNKSPKIQNEIHQFLHKSPILPTEGLIHPQPIMRNPTPARLESSLAVQISQTTPIAYKCTVKMTPDNFYASCMKLPPYNGVIFFELATREVLVQRAAHSPLRSAASSPLSPLHQATRPAIFVHTAP